MSKFYLKNTHNFGVTVLWLSITNSNWCLILNCYSIAFKWTCRSRWHAQFWDLTVNSNGSQLSVISRTRASSTHFWSNSARAWSKTRRLAKAKSLALPSAARLPSSTSQTPKTWPNRPGRLRFIAFVSLWSALRKEINERNLFWEIFTAQRFAYSF